jgi:hypothetical protein
VLIVSSFILRSLSIASTPVWRIPEAETAPPKATKAFLRPRTVLFTPETSVPKFLYAELALEADEVAAFPVLVKEP